MLNKKALQHGLMLGGSGIVLSLIIYFMGVEVMTNWWVGIGLLVVILGLYIFFSLRLKKASGLERISYWQAFFAIMIMSVIAGLLNAGYQRTINYLDPHLIENIENATIQKTTAFMEKFGAPQEKIDQTIDDMQVKFEQAKNITFMGVVKDMLIALFTYSVFAFIMAIFVRRSPPVFPEGGNQQAAQ
ncbi:MAG: DUF4199 domain-containing protein [Bacteroidia bacterium]